MMIPGLTRTGFVLSMSMLLAAILYFFAANWGGMAHMQKIMLAAGLTALLYSAAFIVSRARVFAGHEQFLGNLLLTAGCIAFGISLALIYQIYNSHADNYQLFLYWTVPALLFSVVCRYSPFYVLTFALGHLSLLTFFFPTAYSLQYSEPQLALIAALFAVANGTVFALCTARLLRSGIIRWLSFVMLHIALLAMSNSLLLEQYGPWLNVVPAAAIVAGFFYFGKYKFDRLYVTMTGLAASVFAVLKFTELTIHHASEAFFIFGLLFVALLLTGNVLFFRYVNKMAAESTEATDDAGADTPPAGPRVGSGELSGSIVSTIVTIIGIFIGAVSLFGLILLLTSGDQIETVLLVSGLLLIAPMLLLSRINPAVRYTLLTIGYLVGFAGVGTHDKLPLTCLFILVLIFGWLRLEAAAQRLFTYMLLIAAGYMLIYQLDLWDDWTYTVLTLLAANIAVFAGGRLARDPRARRQLHDSSLFFALLFLFWLTFLESVFPYAYTLFNIVYAIGVTALLALYIRRRESRTSVWITLLFWFAFLIYKYYDLLWSLLHKSLTLAIAGLLLFALTWLLSRRSAAAQHADGQDRAFLYTRWAAIALIIVLQFGFLAYETARSEHLLATGSLVKLELRPVDPRSLMQGDYVQLSFAISAPPGLRDDPQLKQSPFKHVRVAIAPDSSGVYVFSRLLAGDEQPREGETAINGKYDGWGSIIYGIESYFVPEGTGLEVERTAKFAEVKVSAKGNALLVRLTEN